MQLEQPHATVADLEIWALGLMSSRPPDVVIGEKHNPYMRRWHVIPRNMGMNVYLHEILRSDHDFALHDHPWANTSLILAGTYMEHTPDGIHEHGPGTIVHRHADALHRLELPPTGRVISLFTTGPKVREWGFQCPQGWRHWKDVAAYADSGLYQYRGCGEN